MNAAEKNIIRHLTGKDKLEDVASAELEELVVKYPYFIPARLLYTRKKYSELNFPADILRHTSIHFSNPFWMNYLLHSEETVNADAIIADQTLRQTPATITGEPEEQPPVEEKSAEIESIATIQTPADDIVPSVEVDHAEDFKECDEIVPAVDTTGIDTADALTVAINIENTDAKSNNEEQVPPIFEKDDVIPSVEVDQSEDFKEYDEIIPATEIAEQHISEIENETEPQPIETSETAGEEDVDTDSSGPTRLSSLIEKHLADFKKPVTEKDELPVGPSPFHTIDYFESQGIRADGSDKLSSKVRKFTDWLKQMKSVNPQPSDLGTDAETEKMIETIAETSNETKEIVTEAMAEVLVKQGKTAKAILLYKKLSFLNPGKSTYFAARIEELKG